LGSAFNFAVLAGKTVTSTGATIVAGDVGVSPGSSVTGFPPGIVLAPSSIFATDAVADQAESDASTVYTSLAGTPHTTNLTGQNLGGLTLLPGVYNFSSSGYLTGTLTLNANGNPSADFIFQFGSTLTADSNSVVMLENDAEADNVFWQVGSSATLDTNSTFVGNVLAETSITMDTGSSLVDGRALALNGAVTLRDNRIIAPTPEASSVTFMGLDALLLTAMMLGALKRHARGVTPV
jgi:hypothetical protein